MSTPLAPDLYRRHRAMPRGFGQSFVREGEGGEPLVLVHGWPETSRIWWRNIGPLAQAGFDVVAPDLRNFGQSDYVPDSAADIAAHSADLYALLRRELGFSSVTLVGGDLGGAIAQDFALRFPGFTKRLVVFNSPLPYLREAMAGLRTRPVAEASDYFVFQGLEADRLGAQLAEDSARRRYVATFYSSRFWAHPGGFGPADIGFHIQPFDDADKFRCTFHPFECALDPEWRRSRVHFGVNPVETLVLFGASDHSIYPDFDRMATHVFPNLIGPFRVPDTGHFVQWEAADVLNGAISHLCRPDFSGEGGEEVFVALGSNLGEREAHLGAAFTALRALPGVWDVEASRVYETRAVGPGEQGSYLNAVARLRTRLEPRALLERLLEIEHGQGRERGPERNAARTLDLDLLVHGERVIDEPGLCVPHPRLYERPFVLEPLSDLAPELVPPGATKRVLDLAGAVRDPDAVRVRET